MKRMLVPVLFCASFALLCLAAQSYSGPFAARRAARLAARAGAGCSGSAQASAGCSGAQEAMTYTYYVPAPAAQQAAPVPPPKPISTPTKPNILEVASTAGKAATATCACGLDCPCYAASHVKTDTPKADAIKPNRPANGTLIVYGGRLWRWNTEADDWKIEDVPAQPAYQQAPIYYSQPMFQNFGSGGCSSGSCS